MKASTVHTLVAVCAILTCDLASGQTAVVSEPVARGTVVVANPASKMMTIMVKPGHNTVEFYGLERALVERSGGTGGHLAELRPGMRVAVYYTSHEGRWYPSRILIPDANLAVPFSPLTPAENKALNSKTANDGDITTNPGVKARIDKDITTQPGKKDPADQRHYEEGKLITGVLNALGYGVADGRSFPSTHTDASGTAAALSIPAS